MSRIILSPDPSSEELALYKGLTARQEIRRDVFIAESVKVIEAALDAGLEPVSLLMERRHLEGKAAHLAERAGGVPVYAPPDEWNEYEADEIGAKTRLFFGKLLEKFTPLLAAFGFYYKVFRKVNGGD